MIEYNDEQGKKFIDSISARDPLFLLTISYTETSEIDGITVAGADKGIIKYTPAADAELIHYGFCKCINSIPATPDGKPTPALLTRAALRLADIPMLVIDAGSKIKPNMPYFSIDATHARSIEKDYALDRAIVERIYKNSIELGKILGKLDGYLVIGESIPGGTTTALAVLLAMGIDARFKVSSSMPNNPHNLKIKIVEDAMKRLSIEFGALSNKPIDAVSLLGDAMMITVAGIAIGASYNTKVMLAGGTQMAAVISLINALDNSCINNLAIGTTRYIYNDKSSDIVGLVREVADIPIISVDPMLDRSSKEGLRAYAEGFVKEGAGAGGACIAALLKKGCSSKMLLDKIEEEYNYCIKHQVS